MLSPRQRKKKKKTPVHDFLLTQRESNIHQPYYNILLYASISTMMPTLDSPFRLPTPKPQPSQIRQARFLPSRTSKDRTPRSIPTTAAAALLLLRTHIYRGPARSCTATTKATPTPTTPTYNATTTTTSTATDTSCSCRSS